MKQSVFLIIFLLLLLTACNSTTGPNQTCLAEGESHTYYFEPTEGFSSENIPCCEGLTRQHANHMKDKYIIEGECKKPFLPLITTTEITTSTTYTCSECGNGICSDGETVCSCPQDCKENGMTIEEFCETNSVKCVDEEYNIVIDKELCGKCTEDNEETLCPEECPQLSPPSMDWCKDGDRVGSQVDECGCRGAPICLPKENCGEMTLAEAWTNALSSECAEELRLTSKDALCNEGTNTWWIDLVPDENGCNPACVVHTETGAAEINWRCTGALVPSS